VNEKNWSLERKPVHATKGRSPIPSYPAGETVEKGLESITRKLLYMSSAVEGEVRLC